MTVSSISGRATDRSRASAGPAKRIDIVAKLTRWMFEGEMRTTNEVCAMVPRLGRNAVIRHLRDGRNTVMAMMSYDPKRASDAGARKAYKARGKTSILRAQINAERNR